VSDNLSPLQFGNYTVSYAGHEDIPGSRRGLHRVVAEHEGQQVGSMTWQTRSKKPGEIEKIEVEPDHQRQGLATAMWNYAHDSGIRPSPKHSSQRTDAGEAWSKAVGGPRPRRVQ
jgi:GNAT superfamily N-acetyltransferase